MRNLTGSEVEKLAAASNVPADGIAALFSGAEAPDLRSWDCLGKFEAFVKDVGGLGWTKLAVTQRPLKRFLSVFSNAIEGAGGANVRKRLRSRVLTSIGIDPAQQSTMTDTLRAIEGAHPLDVHVLLRPQLYNLHPQLIRYDHLVDLDELGGGTVKAMPSDLGEVVALIGEIYDVDFEVFDYRA